MIGANRNQEAQSISFPLQIPILAGYFISVNALVSGASTVLAIMSFIPFTAPLAMLARMASGDVALWEIMLSIGLTLVTIYLVMRLAIVIFTGGILRTGKRVSIRQAWRGANA